VIRNADWVLDLGPEGGEDGGRVVGEGRPAKIAATPGSYTGQFLRRYYTSNNGHLEPADLGEEILPVPGEGDTAAHPGTSEPAPAKRPRAKRTGQKKAPRKKKTGMP
jgi:excinuclease ABC subunit A